VYEVNVTYLKGGTFAKDTLGTPLKVIEVNEIDIYAGFWDNVTDGNEPNIVILKGTQYTFRALPNPSGYGWPASYPTWTLNSTGIGAAGDPNVNIAFNNAGTFTLNAKCVPTDSGKSVAIKVIEPYVYQIDCQEVPLYYDPNIPPGNVWADGNTPIDSPVYDVNTSKNEPFCIVRNTSISIIITLQVEEPLTYSPSIKIDANGTQEWNESEVVPFGTTTFVSGDLDVNEVKVFNNNFQLHWYYKVTNGSNSWYSIETTSHTLYVIYGPPNPGGCELTVKRISTLCTWANGANTTSLVADGIHSHLSLPFGHDPNKQSDDWDLMWSASGKVGECDEHARFMVRTLDLIGATGYDYLTLASTDSTIGPDPEDVNDSGNIYYLSFDFGNTGYVNNRFEGSVSSGGKYYAVTPKLSATSKCGLLRQIGPDSYHATQRWAQHKNDDFWNQPPTGLQLPGTVSYPSCP
jgi:hypothetical protein